MKPLKSLLRRERLLCLVRAHEVKPDGFEMHLWEGQEEFPLAITVFSAPNYCNSYGNRGAILIAKNQDTEHLQVKQFDPSSDIVQPYQLPNSMDVLAWSAPFLADCVTQMFYAMLSQATDFYDHETEKDNLDKKFEINTEIHSLL